MVLVQKQSEAVVKGLDVTESPGLFHFGNEFMVALPAIGTAAILIEERRGGAVLKEGQEEIRS